MPFCKGWNNGSPAAGLSKELESVASFFVSRIDVEVDRRLDAMTQAGACERRPPARQSRDRKCAASLRVFEETIASPRWQALQAKGGQMQRLLWASTGVKDKAYDDTRYVVELAAPDTVNTMPAATLAAVADHGQPRGDAITGTYKVARKVFRDLQRIGIDFEDVVKGWRNRSRVVQPKAGMS